MQIPRNELEAIWRQFRSTHKLIVRSTQIFYWKTIYNRHYFFHQHWKMKERCEEKSLIENNKDYLKLQRIKA